MRGTRMARVVVVSGGGTGMGKAIAARFAAAGEHVVILGRGADALRAAASELSASGPGPAESGPVKSGAVDWYSGDLSRPDDVERVTAQLPEIVDVLVNNAGGIASRGMPEDALTEVTKAWQADYDPNVLSAVLLTTALGPRLRRPGRECEFHRRPARRRRVVLRGQGGAPGLDLRPGR